MRLGWVWLVVGWGLIAAPAEAINFKECTLKDGSKVFTDGPCPNGSKATDREMADPKPPPPVVVVPAAPSPDVDPNSAPTPDPAPPPPPPKIKNRYRCIRPEGGDYISNFDNKETRWVPMWTVQRPNLVLDSGGAQVRVGRPPTGTKPNATKSQAETGSNLVLVRDQCLPLSGGELCTYIKAERARITGEIESASESKQPELQNEASALDQEFVMRCRT